MKKNNSGNGAIAIIPIRSVDLFDDQGKEITLLDRPLWEYTVAFALQSESLDHVIVACDDSDLLDAIKKKWAIEPFIRPKWLSEPGIDNFEVLKHVVEKLKKDGAYEFTRVVYMEITHPIRKDGLFDIMVKEATERDLDILFTAYEDPYNFWCRDEDGNFLTLEAKTGPLKSPMFKEMLGLCSIFKTDNILMNDFFGKKIAIVPIRGSWGMIDLRDKERAWIAEAYLKRDQNRE